MDVRVSAEPWMARADECNRPDEHEARRQQKREAILNRLGLLSGGFLSSSDGGRLRKRSQEGGALPPFGQGGTTGGKRAYLHRAVETDS